MSPLPELAVSVGMERPKQTFFLTQFWMAALTEVPTHGCMSTGRRYMAGELSSPKLSAITAAAKCRATAIRPSVAGLETMMKLCRFSRRLREFWGPFVSSEWSFVSSEWMGRRFGQDWMECREQRRCSRPPSYLT